MVKTIQVYIQTFNCGVGVTEGTSIKKIDLSVFRQVNVRFYKINVY